MDHVASWTSTNAWMRISAMAATAQTLMADLIAVVQQRVKVTDAKMTLTSVKLGQGYVKMEPRVTMSLNSAIRVTATMATLVKIVRLTSMNVRRIHASTVSALTRSTHTTVFATLDTLADFVTLTSTNVRQIHAATVCALTNSTLTAAPVTLDTRENIVTLTSTNAKMPASTVARSQAA